MLSAKEIDVPVHSQQRACEAGTMYPIPDKGEVILLEDNSAIEPLYESEISAVSDINRAASRINVNKSYSIRIQNQGGKKQMSNVHVMDHPLIQHKIGIIRREETGSKDFRMMIGEIAMLMCYEATSQNEPTMEDVTAIADYLDVAQEQFHECKLSLTGSLKVGKMI